jgi:hypothetical protein
MPRLLSRTAATLVPGSLCPLLQSNPFLPFQSFASLGSLLDASLPLTMPFLDIRTLPVLYSVRLAESLTDNDKTL